MGHHIVDFGTGKLFVRNKICLLIVSARDKYNIGDFSSNVSTRERIQLFEGVVIKRRGGGISETFTVRKISYGVGVERTFPVHTPKIAKLEVTRRGKVRRAKLYYLRNLRGKAARIKEIR